MRIKTVSKIAVAIINIIAGAYLAYRGWQQGGVYIPTMFYIGCVMFCFGVALLFVPTRKKKKLEYKDIYIRDE